MGACWCGPPFKGCAGVPRAPRPACPPSSTRTGTPGSPTATSSPGRTAWSSCGTTGASGATCPATTTSPTPAKWGWVSCPPRCTPAPGWGAGAAPLRDPKVGVPHHPHSGETGPVHGTLGLFGSIRGRFAPVWGSPSMAGCNDPLPPLQSSAGHPPPSAMPVPSVNQSSATRLAPSHGTSAAAALSSAARPSSGAGRMGRGSRLSWPAAPVSVGLPPSPPLPPASAFGAFPSPGASCVPPPGLAQPPDD